MGMLVDGVWHDQWYDTKEHQGKFVRSESQFRNWITADGDAGPTGEGGFKAESGRYHLYVSMACPWAHRTLIVRQLKSLNEHIDVSVVGTDMLENGWEFSGFGARPDAVNGARFLHEIYTRADSTYSGRVTVPILWDRERQALVSNESSEIVRMFNTAFNHITGNELDLYPKPLRAEIDAINADVYKNVNNGVYRCGFATEQGAYEEAYKSLFATLDHLDTRLSEQRYLVADAPTEADWRLFPTLIRFDSVYFGHFKCNKRRIEDYQSLSGYTRELYQTDDVSKTVDLAQIKRHYYYSHESINPTRVVPMGPKVDFTLPHNRA